MSSATPLTHHEIMALVAPFARLGRHVDLTATDRSGRRLAFRVTEHPAVAGLPALTERLTLDAGRPGFFRLIRRLEPQAGPAAELEVEGRDPAALVAALEQQPVVEQFGATGGYLIAWQQHLAVDDLAPGRTARPRLIAAEVQGAGFVLLLRMSRVASVPADVLLDLDEPVAWQLPDDLLAVLGRRWGAHPRRTVTGWATTLLLRGRPAARSALAAAEFERAVRHVMRTLAEPPAAFHRRCSGARWGVTARRSLPLAFGIALLVGAVLLRYVPFPPDSSLRMLVFNAPPILLVVCFSLREMPRIELPRWPRPSPLTSWRSS